MRHDAEFVVNRFRWGGFGLTVGMDEQGLAEYLVGIGNNPARTRRIFERLRDAHPSDSDDVAFEYVQRAPDRLLRVLKAADPGLIELLVDLMESGYTSRSEREAIERLRSI
ncbi:MAG: hypothetical protein IPM29_32335 [Planctomycetes bacterium]|nr:hypothetical protein [Planctomycetota bacterium]